METSRRYSRVEYVACQPEVIALFKQGQTIQTVYDKLKKENKITMHYSTFWRYAFGLIGGFQPLSPRRSRKTGDKKTAPPASLPAQAEAMPAQIPDAPRFGADARTADFTPKEFDHPPSKF